MLCIWAEIRNAKEISKEEKEYKVSEKQKAEADLYIKELDSYYKQLSKSLKNERLLEELDSEKINLLKKYKDIIKSGNTGESKKGHRQT